MRCQAHVRQVVIAEYGQLPPIDLSEVRSYPENLTDNGAAPIIMPVGASATRREPCIAQKPPAPHCPLSAKDLPSRPSGSALPRFPHGQPRLVPNLRPLMCSALQQESSCPRCGSPFRSPIRSLSRSVTVSRPAIPKTSKRLDASNILLLCSRCNQISGWNLDPRPPKFRLQKPNCRRTRSKAGPRKFD
jgi:hypothetical protein